MSNRAPRPRTSTPASALTDEIGALRRQVADLTMACENSARREAAMRQAMADLKREINRPLSVLVLRVDLMLLEGQHELPLVVREDLVVLQQHLERLRQVVASVLDAVEPAGTTRVVVLPGRDWEAARRDRGVRP